MVGNSSGLYLVYFSKTGQTERFIKKVKEHIEIPTMRIEEDTILSNKYILLTPTYFFGQVPDEVSHFLNINSEKMIAVMSSGNRNWGGDFAKSGELISQAFNVPLIGKYELSGTEQDVQILVNYIEQVTYG